MTSDIYSKDTGICECGCLKSEHRGKNNGGRCRHLNSSLWANGMSHTYCSCPKFKPQTPQKTNTPLEDTNITEMATGSSVSKSRMDFTNKTSKGDNTQSTNRKLVYSASQSSSQTPPTLKDKEMKLKDECIVFRDEEGFNELENSAFCLSKDIKESLKRLRDEYSEVIDNIKKNGTDRLGSLNSAYCEFINKIDKIMGDWE